MTDTDFQESVLLFDAEAEKLQGKRTGMRHVRIYAKLVKPLLDWVAACALLVLLLPIWLLIACVLFISNRGRVFFCQQRPGHKGRPFYIIKFRTMTDARDKIGNLLPDEERKTRIGTFLRRTSLDEIPQLFNVLLGQLSFIGPRPLLMEYLPLYSVEQSRRHEVKPGMTGLAQIRGRNHVSWEQRFQYDIEYVDNVSIWLDLKILLLTLPTALSQQGIDPEQPSTEARFTGTQEKAA